MLHPLLCAAILTAACVSRPQAIGTAEHVRGTIVSVDAAALVVATGNGSVRVQLAPATGFATVSRSDCEHIADGSFLGIASVTAPDGSQRATEVTIFPESLRGTGEGQIDWDLPSTAAGSKMTNGSVASSKMTNGTATGSKMTNGTATSSKMTNGTVSAAPAGSLILQFKDGEQNRSQTITIPADIPVVALAPAQAADVQRGAHAVVFAHRAADGTLIADRVIVGRNGIVPPM